jgi:hypothetical protein
MFISYLIKSAMGSPIQAKMTHPLTQEPVPEEWTVEKQRELDSLFSRLPPSVQSASLLANLTHQLSGRK